MTIPGGGGRFEVIDGQHTAIAAATHGSIASLPCLVLSADTAAKRSAAFVGINHDRVTLTPHALWRARCVAGDPSANAVLAALEVSGASLVATFSNTVPAMPGQLSCVGTLRKVERDHGGQVLTEVLTIAVKAALAPIPAAVLRALADIRKADAATPADALTGALARLGGSVLSAATERKSDGRASSQSDAVQQLIVEQLEAAEA